ncbi:MAG: nucleotidyltransferase family protein [Candidatus Adiutrix sp.]
MSLSKNIYTINEIATLLHEIFVKNQVAQAYLFGSYAKGTQTAQSDIDIFAEFENSQSLFDICGILHDMREQLKKDVDFFDKNELARKPEILETALKEGVCIYEKQ